MTLIFSALRLRAGGALLASTPKSARALFAVLPLALSTTLAWPSAAGAQSLSARDIATARAALSAYGTGQYGQGRALLGRIGSPGIRKLVAWYAYSRPGSGARFADIVAFIRANPDWPAQARLHKNAGLAVRANTDPGAITAFFKSRPPSTFGGQKLAIDRLMAAGRRAAAIDLIRRSWASARQRGGEVREFRARYGSHLRAQDDYARLDTLLYRGHKRTARGFLGSAKLTAGQRAAVGARLAMNVGRNYCGRRLGGVGAVATRVSQVPAALRRGEGFVFDHARFLACREQLVAAAQVFAGQPAKAEHPRRWWRARSSLAREALRQRQNALAYRVARQHGLAGHKLHAHAEWFAGFIAHRFLRNHAQAARHFEAGLRTAESAWTRAKILYWYGLVKHAQGDRSGANGLFRRASALATTFYGQLAHGKIAGGRPPVRLGTPGQPGGAFWRDDLAVAAVAAGRLGLWEESMALAHRAVRHRARTPAQFAYMARYLGRQAGPATRKQVTVRAIKYAHFHGHPITAGGYPLIRLPKANTVEPALVLALIRQESEFRADARSWAGARGYMQLMPFTARREARDLRLRYGLGWLTGRPAYNLRLGTHHLARLIGNLEGAYPMVLAAYNAGESRVHQWIAAHGDPRRRGGPDWVTWIELIRFDETRDYVKRVLEAHTVYRMLLRDTVDTRRLTAYWRPPSLNRAAACRVVLAGRKGFKVPASETRPSRLRVVRHYTRRVRIRGRRGRRWVRVRRSRTVMMSSRIPNGDVLIVGNAKAAKEQKDPLALIARPARDNVPGAPDC